MPLPFNNRKPLRIFTWHVHGSYLFYLSQGDFNIYIPVNEARSEGYYGRGSTFPFGKNVIEVRAADVALLEFDCILFQSAQNYLKDQFEVLSEEQRALPRIYLEHNAPEPYPADSVHVLDDPAVCLVHVTHYNRLMWKSRVPRVGVVEHGVTEPAIDYQGDQPKGIVVVNHLFQRGRKLGGDILRYVQQEVPVDLAGMGSEEYGGLGEILHPQLPGFIGHYRFLFNPIRHTSLALALLEGMMLGMPVVSLATTEYAAVIRDGETGFCDTDPDRLIANMKRLLEDPVFAQALGARGKEYARRRFNISRFIRDWKNLFYEMMNSSKELRYEKDHVYQ
jgi:glycosyltransferase involved in cell wall biosynthesis